ncbi:MAG TPA: hypothetical protein VFG20_04875 [Planctomycetaceae bacterium]|jgi:hypothetical protein|nr:hypothetical protein [Planctomycetaceae bacterium]
MDNEFIGQRELVLGGIGIGAAFVLLVVLSLLQTGRMKREGQVRLDKLKDDNRDADDSPPGMTPFFVARYQGGNARFFRVYQAAGELLFVYAGEYFVLIDPESIRGTDQRHWLLRSVKMVFVGLGAVTIGGGVALAAILRGVARNVHKNPEAAGDIVLIVLGCIAFIAAIAVVGIPLTLWGITKRCRALDAMSLGELRGESELHPKSLRATPETVSEVNVKFLDLSAQFFSGTETACSITFKHATRGKWTIDTLTQADTRAAVQALYAEWGRDKVFVDEKLRARLGGIVPTPPPAAVVAVPSYCKPSVKPWATTDTRNLVEPVRGDTFSMNGCGTMCIETRGEIDWGDSLEDSDSVLALCFVGIPLVPYGAVHSYGWNYDNSQTGPGGFRAQMIPIRWTADLIATALFRRSWLLWIALGVILGICVAAGSKGIGGIFKGLQGWEANYVWLDTYRIPLFLLSGLMVVGTIALRWWVAKLDRRHRDIRLLLGRHLLGSSDPFFWAESLLEKVQTPQQIFGTSSFSDAVSPSLTAGDYARAMFAARLTAAKGNRLRGEQLTDEILNDPGVQSVLRKLRARPMDRTEIVPATTWQPDAVFAAT